MEFGDRLKQVRLNGNQKQEEVANMLGVDRSTYTNYENNTRFPTKDTLIKMLTVFKVSIDYLLSGQGLDDLVDEKVESYMVPVTDTLSLKKASISWDSILYYRASILPHGEGNNHFYYKVVSRIRDNERIKENDLILFQSQNEAEHGALVVALIDNEVIRVGRIEFIDDVVLLLAINMDVPTLMFNSDSIHRFKVLAKAVEGLYDLTYH